MQHQNIKIAIVDNSIDTSIYRPVKHWIGYLSVPRQAFRAKKGELPDLASFDFSHVILTGSEASIIVREPWVLKEIEFVKEAIQKDIPILGSCYGHQLLVIALTDASHVRRCEKPEIGWIPINIIKDNELLGSQGVFYAFTLHFDEVIDLTVDFELLASTPGCSVHAFRYKGKPFWGIQSHPEITRAEGQGFFKKLISQGTPEAPWYELALKAQPKDSGLICRIIEKFIRT